MAASDLRLTLADKRSDLMRRLVAHWEAELGALRARNDDHGMNEQGTARLRGRIEQIKQDIALAAESAPMVEPDE